MTTQRKDNMVDAATNSHLKMEKEPSSIPQTSGWTNKAMGIGGAIVQGLAGSGPLIFSCVCLFLAYKNREKRNKVLQRSVSLAALHGGKVTLERIRASADARLHSSAADFALKEFTKHLQSEPIRFTKLQKEAAKLEMRGQEHVAVEMLMEAHDKAKREGNSHEAYELEMLLVEMLIYTGDYMEALNRSCLEEKEISDARRPLYKAVIHIILKNIEQAKIAYDEFLDLQSNFIYRMDNIREGSPDIGHNFGEFEKVVNRLKKEIEIARKNKSVTEIALPEIKKLRFGDQINKK